MINITDELLEGLEDVRRESLEADIVAGIARRLNISSADAMRLYFSSKLCGQIEEGAYGIQYLDASYLVDDLFEHEPELFVHDGHLR